MGFVQQKATPGKVTMPIGAQKEAELKFMQKIVNQVENGK